MGKKRRPYDYVNSAMSKSGNKQKIYRFFMATGGIILIIAGFLAIFSENKITSNTVIQNFVFFLAGGALIYSGLKWTGKK